LTRILAFRVLTHKEPVNGFSACTTKRRLGTGEGADGTHVGVELEGAADCEEEAPKGDMVGYVCVHKHWDLDFKRKLTGSTDRPKK